MMIVVRVKTEDGDDFAAADDDYDESYDDDKDVVGIKDDDGNGHLCSMSMHWPSLQVNSPSEHVVSFIRFTCTRQNVNEFKGL